MSTDVMPQRRPTRLVNGLLWAAQFFAGVALFVSGALKLAGVPMMVQLFREVGLGQWLRYVTGALEVIGGAALLIPAWSGAGALLLTCVMSGAVLAHLLRIGGNIRPSLLLLVLVAAVAWGRWERTARLLRR
jgi:putative oxidoreductase